MPDEIDRDQEFNEQRLEEMIEQSRFKPAATPSLFHCRFCGKPIPEIRRQTLPGVITCMKCQTILESRRRWK
ncbi:TraR/DksA family transcriptional regulator [Salmonella enterica]|uniref:TraR/DksA family transcriptional regulator n=1 Tax=Salmonella enterica TaxID=28901 RepID=A0A8E6QK92_SALER|nr:TraR/DksA family transcriptional regulator [Salmonella enterica]EBP3896205.1 TraR/DksA family transcriptional regulator [Salmonella enterica subsp. enterica]EDU6025831.1 TraR/DksA family transcriptional regulator [Salmonella enterica subsp. enterica serovar Brazil]EKB3222938.1 TraR/DksA family transcriptional regulator [Salmonella enterica subsp. enterica serovar Gaminara]EAM2837755.1 TraR/DksA family transcriptional regulator [Salmonella enterica]